MTQPLTLFDKIWAQHEILKAENGLSLLWVDRHYIHEGSFQGFDKVEARGAKVARPDLTFGIADHYVPTHARSKPIADPSIARMVDQIVENTNKHGIMLMGLDDPRQGIVHVVGPEQGLTIPGLVIVCGDSHTATHGALGAIAIGIGASEVTHVMLTQTFWQKKPKRMRVTVDGKLRPRHRRQGHRALDHRQDRHQWRAGPCGRICRPRDPRALDGRSPDAVQSRDRGRRAHRHGGAGRDDLCLCAGPAVRPEGRRFERAVAVWQQLPSDSGRGVRHGSVARCFGDRPGGDLGHQPRGHAADRRRGARSGAASTIRTRAKSDAGRARLYGAQAAPEADRHPRRPRVHRLLHQCAHRGPARRGGGAAPAARPRCRASSRPARRR